MPINSTYTPLPGTRHTPIRIEVPVWEDVPANDRVELFRHSLVENAGLDVEYIGAQPAADVTVEVGGTIQTRKGTQTQVERVATEALAGFGEPIEGGPHVTEQTTWSVRNESATDYTQAAGDPYQLYVNYTVSQQTVLDKLRKGISLTEREDRLRSEFGLDRYLRMGFLPDQDPFYRPTLEEKTVLDESTETGVYDVQAGAGGPQTTVADFDVDPNEVLYITGVSINGQDYTAGDNLQLSFLRNDTDEFYRMETYGVPGGAYRADVHIPILDNLTLTATAANELTDVTVRIKYARVARTLVEKALYGLEQEVRSDDDLAGQRMDAYALIQDYLRAGVPVRKNIGAIFEQVNVPEHSLFGRA